ncbi:MAG: hypothetical protein ACI8QZ_003481 [Chlamydiales bacterium]|jgi:hypothetical protein
MAGWQMILKRLLFVAISVGMVLISLDLIADLGQYHDRIPTPVRALLGVLLTLTITGSVAFPGFVFSLWKALPD